jgi:RNA polymerase sigma-70 factor (ECF subfamily)
MIDINHNHDEAKLNHVEFDALLGDLRDQDPEAWRRAIKTLRPFLKRLARQQLPPRISHRSDASDVVQDTLGEAARSLAQFQGTSLLEFVAWLEQILRNNACDAVRRHIVAEIRSVRHEVVFQPAAEAEFVVQELLIANQSTASQRCRRDEDERRLHEALSRLPERQRIAVRMKHLEDKTLAEIGEVLGCNTGAAAAVVARGILAMRTKLG